MRGFFAMLSRIKYINRWGLMRCTRTETLSEHTLETAMLCHALCAIANTELGQSLDAGKAVLCALYHDCSEIITGDLPTPVKYKNDAIKTAYKAIEAQANTRLLAMLPDNMQPHFAPYFNFEGELALYHPVVAAADKLSAVIKCTEELNNGNIEFKSALASLLASPALELPAAKIFCRKYLPAYALSLDELEHFA